MFRYSSYPLLQLLNDQNEAKAFSFHMLSRTLPNILEISGMGNSGLTNIAKELSQTISYQAIAKLYTKLRRRIPPAYEIAFTMLEGLEKYYRYFERHLKYLDSFLAGRSRSKDMRAVSHR